MKNMIQEAVVGILLTIVFVLGVFGVLEVFNVWTITVGYMGSEQLFSAIFVFICLGGIFTFVGWSMFAK